MDKNEICSAIDSVMRTLDNIQVRGVQNAGNLAGCFSILNDVLQCLCNCDIITKQEKRETN